MPHMPLNEILYLPGWATNLELTKRESGLWVATITGDPYGTGETVTRTSVDMDPRKAFESAVDRAEGWTSYTLERTPDAATSPQGDDHAE